VEIENCFDFEHWISTIEYHLLSREMTEKETIAGCKQAVSYHVPVVCVKPCYVHQSVAVLRGTDTKAATVIGYPFGDLPTSIKAKETKLALTEGVLELNMVANTSLLIDGNDGSFKKDIESICCLARMNGALLNVIINSGFLSNELLRKAAEYSEKIGAAWLSPSTGIDETNEDEFLPIIKEAIDGKINVKTMTSVESFDTWLRNYELGFRRFATKDLGILIKSFEKDQ